ncbi:XRE family transcriptional regulator [Neobacillus drentensis]|uniref:helix-turn-helix domain-containing protein n=1 Tax=Neobacillus drentensis TaxID=220684 RepID=UPI002FFED192
MTSLKSFNPNRLKAARLYEGYTITELANAINISKQAISQFEHGKNQPSLETLLQLINVLKFPRDFFYGEDNNEIKIGNTFFRSAATTNKKIYNSHIQKMLLTSRVYSFLEEYIDFPKVNLPMIDQEKDSYSDKEIEELANYTRSYWGLDDKPIQNIVNTLEKNGLILTSLASDEEKIDAFSQKQLVSGQERYFIVLGSNNKSAVRRQFTAAHELGHLLMHQWINDIEELTKEQYREMERQADYFAACFLLPRDAFLKSLLKPNNLDFYVLLKKTWKVSIGAMIIRAYHLEAISYNTYQYLMRQMSFKGYRKNEPYDDLLMVPRPTVLNKAIKLLITNNILTAKEIINAVEVPKEKIEVLLNLESDAMIDKLQEPAPLIKLSKPPSKKIN